MLLPKVMLFSITTGHVGVVIILLLYSVITILKVQHGGITTQHGCATLNVIAFMVVVIHGNSAILLMFHGHWLLFTLDYVILRWIIHSIIKNRSTNVFDARTILNDPEIVTHVRKYYAYLVYLALCISIHLPRAFQAFNAPIDWSMLNPLKTLLFVPTMLLTEALLCIVIYSFVALANIELDNSCAQDLCHKLNRLFIAKSMIHGALSCISILAHTSWALFISNLQILRWEICKVADARENNLEVYNPENILLPGEIKKHRRYYKICFLYFCVSFDVYLYGMFVSDIGVTSSILVVFFSMVLLEIHEISSVEGGIFNILSRLFSRRNKHYIATWVHFAMYILEWCIAFMFCFYLINWNKDWTVEENGDWMLNMLIEINYDLWTVAS